MSEKKSENGCRPLRVAGMFAGIGGIELGLHRAGHETKLFCEVDRAATAVLKTRMPGPSFVEDIRDVANLPRGIDLLTAGFPCQDLSQAGLTKGMSGKQSSLVLHVFRLLERTQVPWVLLENVPFMLQLGRGEALEHVLSELERLGYVWAYRVVDSRAFGLPQRRQRVFILASRVGDPRNVLLADDRGDPGRTDRSLGRPNGFYWTEGLRGLGWADDAVPTLKGGSTIGIPSPPAILLPNGEIVKPDIRDAERLQGFPADWTKPAEQVARPGYRWKLVGNAVTVDVAAWIGDRLSRPGSFEPGLSVPLHRIGKWPDTAWNVGQGRFLSHCSHWPVRSKMRGLAKFLKYPVHPLSSRAVTGFYKRISNSSLRFPPGFKQAVRDYADRAKSRATA